MFKTKFTFKAFRMLASLMVVLTVALMLSACGDTATAVPAPTTAPAATTTTAAATTTAATTTAATTTAATTTAATTTAATTTAATTTAATTTTAAMATTAMAATTTAPAGTTAAAATTKAAPTIVVAGTVGAATGNAKISLKTLRFGAIPAENATTAFDQTKPLADALSQQLGIPVEVTVGNSYTAVIEALQAGQIDVVWFGPFSYVLAHDKYNAEVFAMQLTSSGADHYYSYIVTTPKTGIKTLADLKGHSFSFVDPASTSGNLIPRYNLLKAGIDPDKDLQATFAGSHDVSVLGVVSGKTDAGAVASDVFDNLVSSGKLDPNAVTIINKSDAIPESPIAYRKELSDNDKTLIKNAFLAIKDPAVLKASSIGGFIPIQDSTYDLLRNVAKEENIDLSKLVG
jgi:phosphonate transport system substrate-binding protein